MDVHGVLDHSAILEHLDLLGHTSNGEVVTVAVKLDTEREGWVRRGLTEITPKNTHSLFLPGYDAGAVIEVAGVGERGQRPHRVVAGELGQTLHEIVQLVQIPALI